MCTSPKQQLELWSCSWVCTPGFCSILNHFHSLDSRLPQSSPSYSTQQMPVQCQPQQMKRGNELFNKSTQWTQPILFKLGYQLLNCCISYPHVLHEFPLCFCNTLSHNLAEFSQNLAYLNQKILRVLRVLRFLDLVAAYWIRTFGPGHVGG